LEGKISYQQISRYRLGDEASEKIFKRHAKEFILQDGTQKWISSVLQKSHY
jgi:hypothetical protein